MDMPTTVEELEQFIDARIENHKAERSTPAVRGFKRELEQWLSQLPSNDRNANRSAVYAVIKTRIGLKSIQSLKDEQVPEARELFEQYKQLFQ
ncbi:hypothetical protein [Lacticaseibacillus saniviri]|uniref:hypothetical protein n=1 Tax=Lacticaseibacillus saniviri TaxID=931533 RepID=UPI001EDD5A8E|nr:hypothetical protein [Lacticaseibacillus saniviri]MCG4280883.1 hypothetical protein [Lacticaseibacillus saniviri]